MITLYAAVGTYKMLDGRAIVVRGRETYRLSEKEFALWGAALWNVYHTDELHWAYSRIVTRSRKGDGDFEELLKKLLDNGIIRQGTGYTGVEALYDLLCGMFLVPIQTTLIQKIYAFIVMTFFRGVPFKVTRHFFKRTILTGDQKQVWNLIIQQPLSTAELIRCAELSVSKLENDHQVVKKLYETGDGVDYTNVDIHSRLSHTRPGIVQAVTNLYLNKLILFETAK